MKKFYETNMRITQKLEDAVELSRSTTVKEALNLAIKTIIDQDAELCEIASTQLNESMKLLEKPILVDREYCGSCGDLLNEYGRCPTCDGF